MLYCPNMHLIFNENGNLHSSYYCILFYFKEMFEQVLMCIGPVQNQNNIYIIFFTIVT